MDEQQVKASQEKADSWMDSGEWAGMTMGEFISTMVDGGNTDICFVRVTSETPVDDKGMFQLFLEVHLVPNGQVIEHADEIGCKRFHNRLLEVLRNKLIT